MRSNDAPWCGGWWDDDVSSTVIFHGDDILSEFIHMGINNTRIRYDTHLLLDFFLNSFTII